MNKGGKQGEGRGGSLVSVYLEAFVPPQGLSFGLCLIRCELDSMQ